ncbi:MAG: 2-dehydropantoate 2-reductase [Thermodesulfobacteriota bacterium]
MKIGVVGPGAMGCLLAGKLALAGNEVVLLDHYPERVRVLNRLGVRIESDNQVVKVKIPVTLDAEVLSSSEVILICVKAYDTLTVARTLQGLAKGPYFLTLQNGVGNIETLGKYLPKKKILGGITSHGATDLGSGRVRHAGRGETFIGFGFDKGKREPRVDQIRDQILERLSQAGFSTRWVPDIENLIWSKLLINIGINALTALTRLPNGKLVEFNGVKEILEEAVREGMEIGLKKGIQFIQADPVAQVKKVCRLTATNVSSMLQDILKKSRTEIDFINGVIVREGRRYGTPVPVNSLLTRLVKTIEQSYAQTVAAC